MGEPLLKYKYDYNKKTIDELINGDYDNFGQCLNVLKNKCIRNKEKKIPTFELEKLIKLSLHAKEVLNSNEEYKGFENLYYKDLLNLLHSKSNFEYEFALRMDDVKILRESYFTLLESINLAEVLSEKFSKTIEPDLEIQLISHYHAGNISNKFLKFVPMGKKESKKWNEKQYFHYKEAFSLLDSAKASKKFKKKVSSKFAITSSKFYLETKDVNYLIKSFEAEKNTQDSLIKNNKIVQFEHTARKAKNISRHFNNIGEYKNAVDWCIVGLKEDYFALENLVQNNMDIPNFFLGFLKINLDMISELTNYVEDEIEILQIYKKTLNLLNNLDVSHNSLAVINKYQRVVDRFNYSRS